jgi:hypothetical protein
MTESMPTNKILAFQSAAERAEAIKRQAKQREAQLEAEFMHVCRRAAAQYGDELVYKCVLGVAKALAQQSEKPLNSVPAKWLQR